jgi:hypothetical protein
MKIKILITDDKGNQFSGDTVLFPIKRSAGGKKEIAKEGVILNFDDMNIRAFIKQYSKKMSGPKKFTLLLAYLVKGESGKEKSIEEIKKQWNKMKSLLGKFNMSYTDRAKIKGWVSSKKYGFYNLTKEWQNVL